MKRSQILNNAKWIIICKITQSLLQFVAGMLSARYLGPANYGVISYATSIMSFTLPIMKLGFDATLVYELVKEPHKEGEIMGTSLILNLLSSVLCYGAIFSFVSVVNADDTVIIIVCLLHATALFFAALEMIQYWFQYKLWSKYTSIVTLFSCTLVSAYKIYLLATQKSVYWFAFSHAIEYAIIGFVLLFIFLKKTSCRFCFSLTRAKSMLSKSRHYILASLMIIIIQNTDHIMLINMVSEEENGYYSAAITSVIVVQFVYYAIVDSFRPMILEYKEKGNEDQYKLNMSRLFCVVLYLVFLQCVVFVVFAKLIITVLYGVNYAPAVKVLRILVFYFFFAFMGVVRNVWILAEQKQKYLLGINITGAVFNIVLNSFLIPYYGACGAAFASFLTQFFMNFVLGFVFKPIREANFIMLRGLNPKFLFKESKTIFTDLVLKKLKG